MDCSLKLIFDECVRFYFLKHDLNIIALGIFFLKGTFVILYLHAGLLLLI